MSLLGKLMDTMRLNPDEEEDDYYLDDDFEEEAPRKGLFSKKNTEYCRATLEIIKLSEIIDEETILIF